MFTKNVVSQSMIDAVNSVLNEDKKKMITDAEIDETGFHKAAHAAKKANQSHFEFQGKKYPVTAKSHKEAMEMEEGWDDMLKSVKDKAGPQPSGGSGVKHGSRYGGSKQKEKPEHDTDDAGKKVKEDTDCVTPPQAKDIAKKEVKGHEKKMHHKEAFALKLLSRLQENKGNQPQETFTDNAIEEEMTDKQKAKREKIVMSMKDKTAGFKQRYGKNWKNVMYATATKQAMKEDSSDYYDEELDEGMKDTMKKVGSKLLKTLGHGSDDDMRKDLQKKMGMPQTGKKPTKEEVEQIDEKEGHGESDPLKNRDDYAKQHSQGQVYKKTYPGDKRRMTKAYAYDISRTGPKSKLPEEVEQIDELSKNTLGSYVKSAAKDVGASRGLATDFERNAKSAKNQRNKDANKRLSDKFKAISMKRHAGISKAVGRLTKEDIELLEKNNSHTHAAHYEDPKTGEWTGMQLISAKDDQDAIDQAHSKCKEGCRLSKVERHTTVKEDVTTDMLSGRESGGHSNGFKSFKVKLQDEIKAPEEEKATSTKARSSIEPQDNSNVEVKLDPKLGEPSPFKEEKQTPKSRATELAMKAMKKIKNETMMGKISN